jgi:uncharacterized protein
MKVKIHNSYRDVIAICDSDLVGKKFEQDDFQLDVKPNFFDGEEINQEKLLKTIQLMKIEDATFNIIGKEATQTAVKAGIISEEEIKTIQDIPFALVLL